LPSDLLPHLNGNITSKASFVFAVDMENIQVRPMSPKARHKRAKEKENNRSTPMPIRIAISMCNRDLLFPKLTRFSECRE
jgi:hypothetical protein